jgi:hypothetical protein
MNRQDAKNAKNAKEVAATSISLDTNTSGLVLREMQIVHVRLGMVRYFSFD